MSENTNDKEFPLISIKKEPEPTGNDEIEHRSCANCAKLKSCSAVWYMKKTVNEFHKEFKDWIEFPFPVAMLALKCKEYLDKQKIIKPEK